MAAATRYKLIFTVPKANLEACKAAIFAKGAGAYPGGKYSLVCFEIPGSGQFMPSAKAKPHIGVAATETGGTLERVDEIRVETLCVGRDITIATVEALKRAHPYEEPAYEVYKLEDF